MIRHLRHPEIDKQHWDAMLLRCPDRLWYVQSWVLDSVCPKWEALIDDERGAIMPLLWRRKFGVDYLYQPYAIQQQGVFAPVREARSDEALLDRVPARFRYWDIHVNANMEFEPSPGERIEENTNQTLLLDKDIEGIRKSYSQGHRRNLRKGGEHPPTITEDLSLPEFIALFQRTTAARFGGIPAGGLELLRRLLEGGLERAQCRILCVREKVRPISAVCFMEWEGRSILLKSANDERGQERQAMFHLIDHYIASRAGTGMLLDFAGSNTPSVARFNAGFGAQASVYLHLVRNRLPPPLRWFKR